MNIDNWKHSLELLLEKLYEIDFGYPLGENKIIQRNFSCDVSEAMKTYGIDIPLLEEFYLMSDGISLPDIQNGYFLKSLSDFIEGIQGKEPISISGEIKGQILVLGSTGSGQKIVFFKKDKSILLLENELVKHEIFYATNKSIKVIAISFEEFLNKLLQDVDAFVNDIQDHIYIA